MKRKNWNHIKALIALLSITICISTAIGQQPATHEYVNELGSLDAPTDVCVDSEGNIFVADNENGTITKYGPDMSIIGDPIQVPGHHNVDYDNLSAYDADWNTSFRISIDPTDNLYISMRKPTGVNEIRFWFFGWRYRYEPETNTGIIYRFEKDDGAPEPKYSFEVGIYSSNDDFWPKGLFVDKNNFVYITNDLDGLLTTDYLIKVSADLPGGVPNILIDGIIYSDNSVHNPSDVVVDNSTGNIFVCNNATTGLDALQKIKVFNSNGEYLYEFVPYESLSTTSVDAEDNLENEVLAEEEGLSFSRFTAITGEGAPVFLEEAQQGDAGDAIDENSEIDIDAIEPPENLGNTDAIAMDGDGNLFIVSDDDDIVYIYSKTGEYLGQFGPDGDSEYDLDDPVEIFVTPSSKVYVVDGGNERIVTYALIPYVDKAWMSIDGMAVYVTFTQDMMPMSLEGSNYVIEITGGEHDLQIAADKITQVAPNQFKFMLETPILYEFGQTIYIRYHENPDQGDLATNSLPIGPITSVDGATLGDFSELITNTAPVPPQVTSATIRGGSQTLIVEFNKPMQAPTTAFDKFSVKIGTTTINASLAYFLLANNNTSVALLIDSPIEDEDIATLEFVGGLEGYLDTGGGRLDDFNNFPIKIIPEIPLSNWSIILTILLIVGVVVFMKMK